jgi:hypothetical protein
MQAFHMGIPVWNGRHIGGARVGVSAIQLQLLDEVFREQMAFWTTVADERFHVSLQSGQVDNCSHHSCSR